MKKLGINQILLAAGILFQANFFSKAVQANPYTNVAIPLQSSIVLSSSPSRTMLCTNLAMIGFGCALNFWGINFYNTMQKMFHESETSHSPLSTIYTDTDVVTKKLIKWGERSTQSKFGHLIKSILPGNNRTWAKASAKLLGISAWAAGIYLMHSTISKF